jgi:HSP90 family molecular chaperone
VLLLFNGIDEFVMSNLKAFAGRNIVSAENSGAIEAMPNEGDDADKKDEEKTSADLKLSDSEVTELIGWLRATLGEERVRDVRATKRLRDSPAVITDHESGALRRMLRMVEQANNRDTGSYKDLPPQVLEINPSHPLIVALHSLRSEDRAKFVAEQMYDNALVAAGLLEDPRSMLSRLNNIMLQSLKKE